MRMLSIKTRNLKKLKNDIFDQQSWGLFQSSAFRSSSPEVFYKKGVLNNFENSKEIPVPKSFFIKVANLTLFKIGSGKGGFL